MANGSDVMSMLRPDGGYAIIGDDFDSLVYEDKCKPVTRNEFDAGFAKYDAWKIEQQAQIEAAKQVAQNKLAALGLTVDDLKVLGLG